MAFDPQSFRSALQFDGARPNLFECKLSFPPFVTSGTRAGGADSLDVNRQFSFFCRGADIPGSTMGMFPVYYQGREIKVAGNRTFPEWTVTIINDEDFKVRNGFELWSNAINGHRTNVRNSSFPNSNEYGRDAHIIHLDKSGNALRSYKFIGLWPMDITAIGMDWGTNDVIEEYQVTFAYQWHESNVGDSDGTGGSPPTRNVEII